jgi:hypothetical protein
VSYEAIFKTFSRMWALAAEGKLTIDCEIVPLADVEKVWRQTSNGRRVVFVPWPNAETSAAYAVGTIRPGLP